MVEKISNNNRDDDLQSSKIDDRGSMLAVSLTGSRMSMMMRNSVRNKLASKIQEKRFTVFTKKSGNSSDNDMTK